MNTKKNSPIYFDYAATTPVDPRVAKKMCAYLTLDGCFGNPASMHRYGRQAQQAIDEARQAVADLINADSREIIWTSGATESDNLAIKGAAYFYRQKGRHIITLKTEHKAVLDTCQELEKEGFRVSYLDVLPSGLLDLNVLQEAICDETILVSIMHVNNELGVVQDIEKIGKITRGNRILFHVDAAQSAGKVPIDLQQLHVDFMSFSAHKIYGPKGMGALYVRRKPKARLQALIHGGGHEQGLRSGTLATHQIVGMGEAFRVAKIELSTESARILQLREKLWQAVEDLPGISLNGDAEQRAPGILNMSFAYIDGDALSMALDDTLAVSSGSACNSTSIEPSFVLKAIGCRDQLAHSAIRFSIGRFTTEQDIDFAIKTLREHVLRLAAISPLWHETVVSINLGEIAQAYSPIIGQYFSQNTHIGVLDEQASDVGVARIGVPEQGDVIALYLRLQADKIIDAKFQVYGSGVMIATAAFATQALIDKDLEAAFDITADYLSEQLQLNRVMFHCAMRMQDAIQMAIENGLTKRGNNHGDTK